MSNETNLRQAYRYQARETATETRAKPFSPRPKPKHRNRNFSPKIELETKILASRLGRTRNWPWNHRPSRPRPRDRDQEFDLETSLFARLTSLNVWALGGRRTRTHVSSKPMNNLECLDYVGLIRLTILQCACNVPASRYVIVQFPINDIANFCELEVYVRGTWAYTTPPNIKRFSQLFSLMESVVNLQQTYV